MAFYWSLVVRKMAFAGAIIFGCLLNASTLMAEEVIFPNGERPNFSEQVPFGSEDTVIEKDGWKLETEVLQPGSRSQGYHGVLSHDGEIIEGKRGELLETPIGTLRFNGSRMGAQLWEHTGWVLIDAAPNVDSPTNTQTRRMPPGAKFH